METLRELQPCRWTLPTDVPEHRVPPKLVAETGRPSTRQLGIVSRCLKDQLLTTMVTMIP